ncbi:hypothetical protein [Bacteriovorax sp. BAL6_X]|uniref:hypothetical protein n=1 Tax=Bacteriovorax sp. BAL6_X TaxID=1201290 RepID=UPI00058D8A4C|nr:hypothetical protein [Bacteriovorax sp. BAL6_X]
MFHIESLRTYCGEKELENCYKNTIVKKFRQSFNWYKSHDGKYKNIFPSNIIFVVVTAEPFPATQFSFGRAVLSSLLDKEWRDYFKKKKRPRCLAISLTEFELLCTVSFNHSVTVRGLLEEYLSYLNIEQDLNNKNKNFKYSMKQYLLNSYNIQGQHLPIHKEAWESINKLGSQSFFNL